MNTPKRKSRKEKILENSDEFFYSKEEAEYLGMSGPEYDDEEGEDEEDDLEDEEDDLEDEEDDLEDEADEEENDEGDYDDEEVEDSKIVKISSIDRKDRERIIAKKPSDKERHYVEPKEFDDEIVKYYTTNVISDNLADMISKIAHKLSYASNFVKYTYREEMVGDGIVRMFKALTSKKYDREKGTNPFSYFTRIAFNAFRNRIKKEKHMRAVHEKYQEELLMFSANYSNLMKNNQIKIQRDRKNND